MPENSEKEPKKSFSEELDVARFINDLRKFCYPLIRNSSIASSNKEVTIFRHLCKDSKELELLYKKLNFKTDLEKLMFFQFVAVIVSLFVIVNLPPSESRTSLSYVTLFLFLTGTLEGIFDYKKHQDGTFLLLDQDCSQLESAITQTIIHRLNIRLPHKPIHLLLPILRQELAGVEAVLKSIDDEISQIQLKKDSTAGTESSPFKDFIDSLDLDF